MLRIAPQIRRAHSLVVPFLHTPYTKFAKGVPLDKVRDLTDFERNWYTWTTSTAVYPTVPKAIGYVLISEGECWIVERNRKFSRSLHTGSHIIIPWLDKIKVVKLSTTIISGVLAKVETKDGVKVDAYALVYFKIKNFEGSAYYIDPETNHPDSEKALTLLASKELVKQVAMVDFNLDNAGKNKIAENIKATLQLKNADFGLEILDVELRGIFNTEDLIPDKIRALQIPYPDFEGPGHDLENDYWEKYMTPPFFRKNKYGSLKVPVTPAATTLEWSVPSPPDFHHFNEVRYLLTL